MDLSIIRDAFDRAAKKQKVSSSKTLELIDRITKAIEDALKELQRTDSDAGPSSDPKLTLSELRSKVAEIAPTTQLETSQKDLAVALGKYGKILEKQFNTDLSKAYRKVDWDIHTMNQIIAAHLYRVGLFDVGDIFIAEAEVPEATSIRSSFIEMHRILEAMRSRDLQPALDWASAQHEHLLQSGSSLELKLHSLQFLEILRKGSRTEALAYARNHLAPFASTSKSEIQKLMACLLWVGRLDQSPYTELTSPTHWERMAEELTRQFCNLMDQSYESPLSVVTAAGVQALPTMLKMAQVTTATNQDWQQMKQLPIAVDLGREFQYHSIFVCPVLWEQASDENPPMLMPCGHVLCRQSVVKLSKSSTRHFKCPYCPLDTSAAQCRQLFL